MYKKNKPSGALNHKQRQEREGNKQKLPKIGKFFSQPSASTSGHNVVAAVLHEKPTEADNYCSYRYLRRRSCERG
ncbi:unnamed protein product [Parnassius apollo]|uniref:(apollo) hypothetical protein n=1 Tax=Parnassius apollo TaxID=110799 RepID=A0A8S3Y766_PARAO|nr:unnamed protein product [Parnassius apollo]